MLWSKPNLCTRPWEDKCSPWIKIVRAMFLCCHGIFCILGGKRGKLSCMPNLGTIYKSRARNISFHTPSILHPGPHSCLFVRSHFTAATRRGWLWWWRQNYAACLLLGVASVAPQNCPNVNLWNRPIFQQLGFPNKRLWQLSRRRFCPFLLILACWVFHPTRDSDIYTKLSFSFWHINTVFAVVVVH